ncbi:MAG: SH3 domain-containing protein, partial [Anaerolineae bacterium]|nr:SH3 domain-containing protein [Anaerolineae bacterium]
PVSPPPQFATDATVASIDVYRLNVRSAPSTDSTVLTIVEYGEIYPIVQRSEDGGWYLIQIGNLRGWVSAPLVIAANVGDVPSLQDLRELAVQEAVDRFLANTFNTVLTTGNLNMRSGPGQNFPIVWRIPAGGRATLVGRDAYGIWWQVNFAGITGWVSSQYLIFSTNTNLALVPIR